MTNIPEGCFWIIDHAFDPTVYFQINGLQVYKQEKLGPYNVDKLQKLWRRQYLFFGPIHAVSMNIKGSFIFYEPHAGQLFHCDIPNTKISEITKQRVCCFFWSSGSKSIGLKIYAEGVLTRHIESEIDYSLCINKGKMLENEDELISISKIFNPQQLHQYLQNLEIVIPVPIKPSTEQNSILYTLTR